MATNTNHIPRSYNLWAAISFVVATMVGTGVFTSLGYQLDSTDSFFSIMLLWALGGLAAFTGALSYVALAMRMPRSGGEYHFFSRLYGPALAYVAGLITIVVGFAAPIAASAMAFEKYALNIAFLPEYFWSIGLILFALCIHLFDVKKGGDFTSVATLIKLVLIVVFIVAGLSYATPQSLEYMPQSRDLDLMMSSGFGVSLVYVTYAYTGWNAAIYVLDEIQNPKRNIPLAILFGTAIVTIIYLLLHFVFLYTTPMEAMVGKIDVAYEPSKNIFGATGGKWISAIIAVGLIPNVSSMIVSSSRVVRRMGEDYSILSIFQKTNAKSVPYWALLLIGVLSVSFVLVSTFKETIEYAGFILSFFGLFTVLGLFLHKHRHPEIPMPFGRWFYPLIPLIFVSIKVLIITYLIWNDPNRIWHGLLTFGIAFLLYFVSTVGQVTSDE